MSIKHVTGERVSAGHHVYTSPSGARDGDGYVEWNDDGRTVVSHGGTVNAALAINNGSGGEIAWEIFPVLTDGTVCSVGIVSGTIATGDSEVVFDDVIGARDFVVHLDTGGEYVEVVLK